MTRLINWLDDRTGVRGMTNAMLFEHIPGGARWRYVWGSTLLFTFAVQMITGFFLWTAYSPSSQTAWESVWYIQHQMTLGWLLRGIHHYTAQAMVVLLAIHMLQVVIDGAYRAPREVNFWIGLILMFIVLALSLTGYLLPWDQRGYWSTKVATNIMLTVPGIGPMIQRVLVGGPDYGHHTLTRFFALHAGLLPFLMIVFTGAHVYVFRRHGLRYKLPKKGGDAYFWVDQVLRDAVACLGVLAVVLVLVLWKWRPGMEHLGNLGAELSAPADPSEQFSAARPEWYFLFLFQFLKLPAFAGTNEVIGAVVVPSFVVGVLFLMPILGRWRIGHWFNVAFTIFLITGVVLLTVMAVVEDVGAPALGVPFLGTLGPWFGLGLLALLLLATLVLFPLAMSGERRGYRIGMGLAVGMLVVVALLIGVILSGTANRLGDGDVIIANIHVSADHQRYLQFAILGALVLVVTGALVHESHAAEVVPDGRGSLHDDPVLDYAGGQTTVPRYSRGHEVRHRIRLGLLMVLLVGSVLFVAFSVSPGGGKADYRRAVDEAKRDAERVNVLAGGAAGIPSEGAVTLLRHDPVTQGPKIFLRNCASCHRYDGHDGMGTVVTDPGSPPSAPDLGLKGKRYATREWVEALLDPATFASKDFFGPHTAAHDGHMAKWLQETYDDAKDEPAKKDLKERLRKVAIALSAEAQLESQRARDAADVTLIEEGRQLIDEGTDAAEGFSCTDCHAFRGAKPSKSRDRGRGPDLTGYGSRDWTVRFLQDPGHADFYGSKNDRMPAYGEKQLLSPLAIQLTTAWLRGEDALPKGTIHPQGEPPIAPSTPAATTHPAASSEGDKAAIGEVPAESAKPTEGAKPRAAVPDAPATGPGVPDSSAPVPPAPVAPEGASPSTAPTPLGSTEPAPASAPSTAPSTSPASPDAPASSARVSPFIPLAMADGPVTIVPLADKPPAPGGAVDFVRDIKPLFESRCVKCHGPKKASNGYRLHTKAAAFKGGEKSDEQGTDPIVPGDAKASLLFQFVITSDPDGKMPPKGKAEALTKEQIELLRTWIDGGAKWPDGVELTAPKEPEKT